MTNEERVIKNIESQHRVIDEALKKLKPYKSVCRKCGEVYLTDTEIKGGICEI
jgi:uncharacterized OB-fold protein